MLRACAFAALVAVAVLAASAGATPAADRINAVVVLVLENRSFDHLLSAVKGVDGATTSMYNKLNLSDPNSATMHVSFDAPLVDPLDPDHSVPGTTFEIFGSESDSGPPLMDGFAAREAGKHHGNTGSVLQVFNKTTLPVLTTLAEEFAVFNAWHASIPGPTMPNRLFLHSCTSHGMTQNDKVRIALGFPQTPMYAKFDEGNVTWNMFYESVSTALALAKMRTPERLARTTILEEFYKTAAAGQLPQFSMLDPSYFPFAGRPASDQHPCHNMADGEMLIKNVYEAMRSSPQWNESLLIITYDEHGGFFDHVPPSSNVPAPDSFRPPAGDDPFNFTRHGVRIPTVMASPWINKGVVVGPATGPDPTSEYEHSSIYATMKKLFKLPDFLTKRDEWAGTFEGILEDRATPRTDCPEKLPQPAVSTPMDVLAQEVLPLSDLQMELLQLASGLHGKVLDDAQMPATQKEGGILARYLTDQFVKGNTVDVGAEL